MSDLANAIELKLTEGQETPYIYDSGRIVTVRLLEGVVEVSVADTNIITLSKLEKTEVSIPYAQHQIRGLAPSTLHIEIDPPLPEGQNPYVN